MGKTSKSTRRGAVARVLAGIAALACIVATAILLALPGTALASGIEDRITQVTSEEQAELLSTASIGVQTGGLSTIYAERDYPGADLQEFSNVSDIAAALEAGKIKYAFQPRCTALLYMRKNAKYTYLSPGVYSFGVHIGVTKGNNELTEKINGALQKLKSDGTMDRLQQKWFFDGDYSMDDVPEVESGDVLRVAISATAEPCMFIQDGEPVGLDIDIIKRVAYELGMRVEFQDTTFAGELTAVVSGKADVALAYAWTEERAQQMNFTEVEYEQPWVAMCIDDGAEESGFLDTLEDNFTNSFLVENRWQLVLSGLGVTCLIAACSFVLATLGGALLTWMGRRGGWTAAVAGGYAKLATGIPTLVWLMILYYIVFAGVDLSAIVVAIICFGLVTSAPMAGVFRTGLDGVDSGQVEAASAMGFSEAQTFRHIVLPQAAERVWALYAGEFTGLVKATSIVGYVAITDLTKASDIIRSRTFQAFFPLIATALVYFAVIALASWLFGLAARRLDPKHRSGRRILKGIRR